ncbi:MAG: hypothetical protein ACXWJZ_08160 [Burkholderiaceae bacterium]
MTEVKSSATEDDKAVSFATSLKNIKDVAILDTTRYTVGVDILETTAAQNKTIDSLPASQHGKAAVVHMTETGAVVVCHGKIGCDADGKATTYNGWKLVHPDGLFEDCSFFGGKKSKKEPFQPARVDRSGDRVFLPFAAYTSPRNSPEDPASPDHIYAVYSHNGGNRLVIFATGWIEVSYNGTYEGHVTFDKNFKYRAKLTSSRLLEVTQLGADNKEKPIMLRWNLLTNYLL